MIEEPPKKKLKSIKTSGISNPAPSKKQQIVHSKDFKGSKSNSKSQSSSSKKKK